jgi:glycosyltransferase involved in cell wall biosynthesis
MSETRAGGPSEILILNWRDTGHPEGGGSELFVEELADGLAREGRRVTVVCARYPYAAPRERRPSGVQVVRLGGRLTMYPRTALAYALRRLGRPDVILEVQNGMPFFASLWARRPRVLVLVQHVHRELWPVVMPAPLARVGWWLESRVAPRVNRHAPYLTVSEATRRDLGTAGVPAEKVTVVPCGTPPAQPSGQPRAAEPQLLVLSRLVPHKRIELAIDTLADLLPRFPSLSLVVAGRGWWADKLRQHAAARGMTEHVRFVGHVSEEEKARLYQTAWVNLVPSLKEGWGLTVVEAGTYRTPSVAYRAAGGVGESIRDGWSGLLVDDQPGFVAAVARILEDQRLRQRLGDGAAEHAAGFSWQETVRCFTQVLDKVIVDDDRERSAHAATRRSGTRAVIHDRAGRLLRRRLRGRVDAGTGEDGEDRRGNRRKRDAHRVLPRDSGSSPECRPAPPPRPGSDT